MTQIFLDSQPVNFNGAPPENLIDLISLVTNILEQENRYFTGVSVDSYQIIDKNLLEKPLENFEIVKLVSSSEYVFLYQLIQQNKETIQHLIHLFPKISGQILTIPLKDSLCLLNTYLKDVQLLLDGLKHISIWAKKNTHGQEKIIESLYYDYQKFFQIIEHSLSWGDIGMLSDVLMNVSLFENHLQFLKELPLQNIN